MEVRAETKKIFKDYGKNLVNAGVMSDSELREALCRLNSSTKEKEDLKEHLLSKKQTALLLGYKSARSIDRLERSGALQRISSGIIGQVRYRYSDVMQIVNISY